ncbi:hypothetical protein [Aliarcobacter butzleri]|uniref:hypothetical protein n=1 Tax=Aliarcobacter butzleri TaxID=28197 RepID=UPI0021B1705E|nr:hypothetical protein [Aliarcobacter butzleri]MCT7614148.1 hypothetical protein [Aliarcobacter butzleri]
MNKKILTSLFFIIIFFSACSTKNNISKKEDYKILDEVGIVGIKDTTIQYYRNTTTPYKCNVTSDKYITEIIDVTPLIKILKEKDVKITFTEPTKKLLIIKTTDYLALYDGNCEPNTIKVIVELYDVEDISKNWSKENIKGYSKDISSLNSKRLIYSHQFVLDKYYNIYSEFLGFNAKGIGYKLDDNPNKDKKDINKFYQEVIKDLEKVMKFPE